MTILYLSDFDLLNMFKPTIEYSMAILARGNHVHPMFFFVAFMVVIMFGWITTTTYSSGNLWESTVSNRVIDKGSGLVFEFSFGGCKVLSCALVAFISISFILTVLLLVFFNLISIQFLVFSGAFFALPIVPIVSVLALTKIISTSPGLALGTVFHLWLQIKTPLYGRSVLTDISKYPIKRGGLQYI